MPLRLALLGEGRRAQPAAGYPAYITYALLSFPSLTPAEKVAETVQAYYRQADTPPATTHELVAWLKNLPPTSAAEIRLLAPDTWRLLPSFKRYILEQRGLSMPVYMRAHLTLDELPYWVDDQDGGVRAS